MKINPLLLLFIAQNERVKVCYRIMKTTLFLLFVCAFQLMAINSEAQNANIILKAQNLSVKQIISEIEKQTDYLVVFSTREVDTNREVHLNKQSGQVATILNEVFKNTDIGYEFTKDYILLATKRNLAEKGIAQQIPTITGKIIDENGDPVIGASIMVPGTSIGTITDIDGRFSIQVPLGSNVQISFIGYTTQNLTVRNSVMNVTLVEDSKVLDEVVVVGYGTQRRRDLTGSVASVNSNQIRDIPVASAAQAITGKMAGVQVTQTEGSPDAEIKIRVRGGGSLTQDNSPLYIVDGFPVDNINDIAPSDIASIDVLKDASSTAIYGARGANGVVIVTTKGGFEGKPKVSYNVYYGMKKLNDFYDVLDPYEYVYWQWEVQQHSGADSFEKHYGNYQDMGLYKQMSGTNWQKEIFGNTGTSLYNNFSVTGGSKGVKYNISLTRNDEDDIMLESGYGRTNLNSKTTFEVNKWLSFDMNVRLSDTKIKGGGTSSGSRLAHIVQYRPVNGLMDYIDPALFGDDIETVSTSIINPLKQTEDDYRRTTRQTFNYNGAMTIKILKDLQYRLEYGYQYSKNTTKRFYGLNTSNSMTTTGLPLASIRKSDGKSYRLANILTYSKKDFLPGSNITVMLGEELNESKVEELNISVTSLPKYIDPVGALSMMQLAGKTEPINTVDNPAEKTSSFFGRINYDYKGKYLASAIFRADGSSKFAPGNQWGYFPSAALAWRISDEAFMKSTEKWLSDLKFRVSYGQSGNNRIPNDAWKKTYRTNNESEGILFLEGNEETPSAFLIPESFLSNPDLKWETTITRNIGLDFGLFNQRLSGSVEFYKNTTKDLLIETTIPASSGYTKQYQNIGQTSNRGIEFVLNVSIIQTKDFQLSASFNIAFNKNKIEKLGEMKMWEQSSGWSNDSDGPSGDYLIKEGGKIGLMYGFETDGFYTFDDFDYADGVYTLKPGVADNSSLVAPRLFRPGALKFVNQNPEDDDMVDAAHDKVVIGDANPVHTGGFSLTAQYKGFDFSAFFNWVYGNDIYNANKLAFNDNRSGRLYKNLSSIMSSENRFIYYDKVTGVRVDDPEQLKAMNQHATMWSPAHSLSRLHSWAIEDGSFLRLNNLTIGYSLPKELLSKVGIEQLRIYATGYNLWTWTNYSGYDPEVDAIRGTPLTPGIDYSAYPRSRSYVFGLNLTF